MSLEESRDGFHGVELFEQFELTIPRGYTTWVHSQTQNKAQ